MNIKLHNNFITDSFGPGTSPGPKRVPGAGGLHQKFNSNMGLPDALPFSRNPSLERALLVNPSAGPFDHR